MQTVPLLYLASQIFENLDSGENQDCKGDSYSSVGKYKAKFVVADSEVDHWEQSGDNPYHNGYQQSSDGAKFGSVLQRVRNSEIAI